MEKKKLSKAKIRTIIVAAISVVFAIALIITNFFIPVKYLFSYMVIANDRTEAGVMRVRFIDVGYGDCIIVELPDGKTMLIDGGDGRTANQSKILKYINKSGISEIDYLVCTSMNAEHCGGLAELINLKTVKKVYTPYSINTYVTSEYNNFTKAAASCGAERAYCEYGEGEASEAGYFFAFLSPSAHTNPDGEYGDVNANPNLQNRNDASAVIWLEYSGTSFLLASDITDEIADKICDEYTFLGSDYLKISDNAVRLENCNIMKAANHGNGNSAAARLYDLTAPQTAVFSVGENGFGCPSAQSLSNAANSVGNEIYRTDEHGTITVEVTADGYRVIKEKT